MPSWSEVGVWNHPIGATCLTSSGETLMSQVGSSLGLEVRGSEDTKHHHLASLFRLQQPGGATGTPIFRPWELLGSGESAGGTQTLLSFTPAHSQPQQNLTAPYSPRPLHKSLQPQGFSTHCSLCLSFLSSELLGLIPSTVSPRWAATAPILRDLCVLWGRTEFKPTSGW